MGAPGRHLLTQEQKVELATLAADRVAGAVADRARMVLWWDKGMPVAEIAALLGLSGPTVRKWISRYAEFAVAGLDNVPHPGSAPTHDGRLRGRILALTRQSPPAELGVSHWSSRLMARYLRREGICVSHVFVADLWRAHGLTPHRLGTFTLSTDPDFEVKVADIVGLYLDPPEGAVVVSVDEKTQVQALDRTQPALPITFGASEQRTHDYVRNATTDLFAALDVGTGEITGACYPRHGAQEFLGFMRTVVRTYEGRQLHVVLDNLSAHKTPEVEKWLARNKNVTFHFTPSGSSWLNQIEAWFGILTKQAVRRGTFTSVRVLIHTIKNYISTWNADCKPFKWVASADEILGQVRLIQSQVRAITGH